MNNQDLAELAVLRKEVLKIKNTKQREEYQKMIKEFNSQYQNDRDFFSDTGSNLKQATAEDIDDFFKEV